MVISSWFHNLQNDGNELCSQFSRYIAPAYHHDKCERCVQMRLYSMNKTELTFSFVVFFVLFFLTLVIGLSGPPIEYTYVHDTTNLNAKTLEKGGPFSFTTSPLTRYNKQIWLFVVLHTGNQDDETYSAHMQVSVTGSGLGISEDTKHAAIDKVDKNAPLSHFIIETTTSKNRTRNVQCKMRTCQPILIAHLSYIKYVRYKFEVKFSNFENFHRKYNVKQLTFMMRGYTADFIQMEMSFRIMYVVVTVFATLWFGNSLRKYPISDWSYEQKWIMITLIFLQFYNGPTYSMATIFNHWFLGFVNSVFQSTFIAVMAFHYLCLYHAFRQNERRFGQFYLDKFAIVFLMWFLEVLIIYCTRVHEYYDLSYSFKLDNNLYQTINKWWQFFGVIYLLYLLAFVFKAYTDLRMMPFFSKRLKMATVNTLFYATIWVAAQRLVYGVTDFIEDGYISDTKNWQTHNSSVVFMALYGAINFYTYLLVYIYSPAQKPIFENVVMKDNPAFSMVNDSEDEENTSFVPLKSRSAKSLLYASDEDDEHELKLKDTASSLLLGRSNDDSD